MQVCDFPQGRYGNAIFRYLASSLFCILYDSKRTYDEADCDVVFSDADFIEWSNTLLNNEKYATWLSSKPILYLSTSSVPPLRSSIDDIARP